MPTKHLVIIHDVLGTLFSLSSPTSLLLSLFSPQLPSDPLLRFRMAELIVMNWYQCAQRDFHMLSAMGRYKPIGVLLKAGLVRALLQGGLIPPEQVTSGSTSAASPPSDSQLEAAKKEAATSSSYHPFSESLIQQFMDTLPSLSARPGMVEAFTETYHSTSLRPRGVGRISLWGATNGSLALGTKLFENSLGSHGVNILQDHASSSTSTSSSSASASNSASSANDGSNLVALWSCDSIGTAKPDPKVYSTLRDKVISDGAKMGYSEEETSIWFVASHTWDLEGAKTAGFKTMWLTNEEFHSTSSSSSSSSSAGGQAGGPPRQQEEGEGEGAYSTPLLRALDVQAGARKILQWERETSENALGIRGRQ